MADRRAQQYPPGANVALASQWSGSAPYPSGFVTSQDHYSAATYHNHPSLRTTSQPSPPMHAYDAMSTQAQAIAAQYQLSDGQMHYSTHIPTSDRRSSMSMSGYGTYAVDGHHGSPNGHVSSRSHSQSYSHSHSPSHGLQHSPSHAYSQGQAMSPSYGAPLASSPQSHSAMADMATAQYASQAAYAQHIDTSQYPASPPRPFACDMCALSFNRQHDLKRHRDTHTGEKPFFCTGGCGKTFTRKDALKRHQLVKRCGIEEGAA
ncbi:hypothetical protein BN946_scf184775.g25 [Trametes cinnabarina]|uniref:C2H2-type domain-containing protein n=1 Tax=Pycnoporus cinnabarinus TaxID=5643 RepID=A0A060SYN5_PYCCI|nr:hypothetical protein BN946_scf184775.g25 [Trametes cinnabarina]